MSCGCTPSNDKCVRDGCRNCCYCGKLLKPNDPYYHVKHVAPPEAPCCPRNDTGHVPVTFPTLESAAGGIVFGFTLPATRAVIGDNLIVVQMCKLCGLVYWEPIKKDEDRG